MIDPDHQAISRDPRYRQLLRERGRLAAVLTAVVLAAYVGFILLVAFAKPALGRPIAGGVTSVGIVLGFALILLAIAVTGIYVRAANRRFDRLGADLRAEHDR
ncbi:Uncharacterized membrane protein, DUF485 family [Sphingomonas guangdongensis]|uniref:Uncharacterized membrane protein, DUF485 family n=1 Tax=Sphingomonas guangdongensis TaxID=1141890 RepID=A0A285R0Q3_9SPHN|nr:DUF485 domain-containing protein [Sphingomonas guangdongensis]SOB87414.1 Uncharacterized membrane protein, DUF485 family [Sphingomonas guangdongensis]